MEKLKNLFKTKADQLSLEIKDIIKEAAEFSKNSPEPDASELWTDVYNV